MDNSAGRLIFLVFKSRQQEKNKKHEKEKKKRKVEKKKKNLKKKIVKLKSTLVDMNWMKESQLKRSMPIRTPFVET